MLKNFENWLLENKYSELTSADYAGRIERLCRVEKFTLAHLVENIASILVLSTNYENLVLNLSCIKSPEFIINYRDLIKSKTGNSKKKN